MSRGRLVAVFILAGLGAALCGVRAAAQEETPPKPEARPAGRPVTVIVTAAVGDAGVKDAEVIVIDYVDLKKDWGDMKITPLFSDWEEMRRRHGKRYVTDYGGTIVMPRPAERCYITVRVPGQFGFSEFLNHESSPFLMKLEPDEEIPVLVVDAQGQPVAGVHVGVSMPTVRVVKDRYDEEKEVWLVDGVTGSDGIAHLVNMQWWREPPFKELRENPTEPRVSIAPTFPDLIRAKVDFDRPPTSPVRLVLPPSGKIVVPLPKDRLAYARVRAHVKGLDPEKRAWPLKVPYRVETLEGIARFEQVALNCEFDYEVWWSGLAAPRKGTAKGPTKLGEEVTFPRLDTFAADATGVPPKKPAK